MSNGAGLPSLPPVSDFLGPRFVSLCFQLVQTTTIVRQSLRFWSLSASEANTIVKGIAIFVTVVSIAQTCVHFYDLWFDLVLNFGNLVGQVY